MSDTFLSRIFGLNSIYHHLDNYQYYDDTNDLENNINTVQNLNFDRPSMALLDSTSEDESDHETANIHSMRIGRSSRLINHTTPGHSVSPSMFIKPKPPTNAKPRFRVKLKFEIPPKERALYLWANIINMDEFLNDIYYYYRNKGVNNIIISKLVDLVVLVFILWFTIFLKWGINYDTFNAWKLTSKITLRDLIIPGYFWKTPLLVKFIVLGFSLYICLRVIQVYLDYTYKLKEIKNFYHNLIEIKDDNELMTISWIKIIEKIVALKKFNSLTNDDKTTTIINDLNSKIRLNPHDIANRIMRKENYFIALINKDVLDLSINLGPINLGNANLLTKTLEWNLKLCIFNFMFTSNGQIDPKVLKDSDRNQLSQQLNKRFKMASIINLGLAPFLVIYFILLYFFQNFNEYRLNPSYLLNLRQFTPFSEWKLREFNELPHFFNRRLKLATGPSNNYINQFPSNFLIANLMYLVNFISGSILAILVIYGLILDDEDHNFWSFEITENRSSLFYISIFGTLFAITSSLSNDINDSKSYYYDPEASIKYVSQFTHYLPSSWQGKLHTLLVKYEYCQLFNLRVLIIFNEILSIILTPFLLWFRISEMSSHIIDFFRDYSIHIDGLGYICYFSMFNFEQKEKNMNVKRFDDDGPDDKMIKSYMYFLESYTSPNKPQPKPHSQQQPPAESQSKPANPTPHKPTVNQAMSMTSIDPSSSFMHDSSYYLDEDVGKLGRSGMLGMLNQFYRQDLNKN